jgi:tetratricopeptide (TPR) repeat protein
VTGETKPTDPEQRIRLSRLIPSEILFAGIVFITLGCTVAIWTARIIMRDAAIRYESEPLWQITLPKPKEQPDYSAQEQRLRQDLAKAAQHTGTSYTQALLNLGDMYLTNGKWELAIGCFDNAYKSLGNNMSDKRLVTSIYFSLAHANFELGKVDTAIHWLTQAKAAAESDKEHGSAMMIHIQEELALAYSQADNLAAAKRSCVQLLKTVGASKPDDSRLVLWTCLLADLERRMKDDVGAERLFRQALIDLSKRTDNVGGDIARAEFGLALACAHQGDDAEALRNYKAALAQAEKSEGPHSELVHSIRRVYAFSLWKTNWIAALALTVSNDSK